MPKSDEDIAKLMLYDSVALAKTVSISKIKLVSNTYE